MSYAAVLGIFLVPPLLLLAAVVPRGLWAWLLGRGGRVDWQPYAALLGLVVIALAYTTPWDNYLVASGVWWYDPGLVTGITLGWVPLEEYAFFALQTLMTGLWTLALLRYAFRQPAPARRNLPLRLGLSLLVDAAWATSTIVLLSGWRPGTYLTLILSWALIPLGVQVLVGGDILLARWRLLATAVLVPTVYLWGLDALAIGGGTWTIDPGRTTGLRLGPLPLEEMVFFLMTNLLVACGVVLILALLERGRASVQGQRMTSAAQL